MELKQKIDRLRDKVQPLVIFAITLLAMIICSFLWSTQQYNINPLQDKIEVFTKEID